MSEKRREIERVLIEEHRVLYAEARKLAGVQGAEDLLQDVAVIVLSRSEQLTHLKYVRAWVLRAMRWHFINQYRRLRYQEKLGKTVSLEEAPEPSRKNSAEVQHVDAVDAVSSLLQEVPSHFREVASLVYLKNRSVKEISSELRIPTGTVLSKLHRAKEKLRAVLAA